jgi:NADH-quinone oxidoreductase subunit M
VYGALVAMAQTDFKKLVAYSSVSHMGYVLLGAAAFTEAGIVGANFQMFTHGTSSAMLFLLVGVIYDRAHHRDINGFGGIASQMPVYMGMSTIGIFASLGLPGLSGFVSEALCLVGAWQTFPILTIISTLGIVITAAFFLWTIQRVYLGPLNEKYKDYPDTDARELFCLIPLGFLCILLGVMPYLLINWVWPSLKPILSFLQQ